jgi:hypothetical protein
MSRKQPPPIPEFDPSTTPSVKAARDGGVDCVATVFFIATSAALRCDRMCAVATIPVLAAAGLPPRGGAHSDDE